MAAGLRGLRDAARRKTPVYKRARAPAGATNNLVLEPTSWSSSCGLFRINVYFNCGNQWFSVDNLYRNIPLANRFNLHSDRMFDNCKFRNSCVYNRSINIFFIYIERLKNFNIVNIISVFNCVF